MCHVKGLNIKINFHSLPYISTLQRKRAQCHSELSQTVLRARLSCLTGFLILVQIYTHREESNY